MPAALPVALTARTVTGAATATAPRRAGDREAALRRSFAEAEAEALGVDEVGP
ncbi:hypothetical protein [Streptosporangium sp. KLBMP 9127]|nr:hypothetical protein [Streptosporangium sp. KLBMP 9127]